MEQIVETQVLVVGAGNAALCSAIAAKQRGADVLVLEKAPKEHRGGNSALTYMMRFAYDGVKEITPLVNDITREEIQLLSDAQPRYTQADFYNDLMWVTDGMADPDLANTLVTQSLPTIRWLRSLGHDWVLRERGEGLMMNGGGYGLQQRAFAIAEGMGVQFSYETRATQLLQGNQGRVIGVRALTPQGFVNYIAKSVVLACGSFEANPEMRGRYLGTNWDTVRARGVPFNTGDGLRMALEIGALPHGSWTTCHASAQDPKLPPYSLPKDCAYEHQQNRYSFNYCITVNVHGQRFMDEGEKAQTLIYAKMGRAILEQPGAAAFQIFDAKCRQHSLIEDARYANATSTSSNTLEGLAEALGIDREGFLKTVREYNEAVQPGEFRPWVPDGKGTRGITPPKTNWAQTIDKPPFEGFPVVCGITFAFGGLKIDDKGGVIHTMDRHTPGLYAAGEMVGGLFHWNYPGGSGMMSGAVFGRKAGASAAEYALTP